MSALLVLAALVGCSTPPDGAMRTDAVVVDASTEPVVKSDGAPAATGGQYTFEPAESLLAVKVFNDSSSLLSGVGHDHVLVLLSVSMM